MQKKWASTACLAVTMLCGVSAGWSQSGKALPVSADKYVISAKAGGVNFVEGRVAVARADGRSGSLTKGDSIAAGEKVSTGEDARAEILLNPGSYMRLGGDTSFQFTSTSLDDLKISLSEGNAIFEVIVDDDFRVTLNMPKTSIELTNSGVYRVDVLADGTSKVSVWKGRLEIGQDAETSLKSGKSAVLQGDAAQVAKFDRDEKDALELWSKSRAKELAKVNSKLQRDALRPSLMSAFAGRRWNIYNSFGVWVYDRTGFGWSFLPFGYGWSSPYGYGFGFDIWNCRLPRYMFLPPTVVSGPRVVPQDRGRDRLPLETPPFRKLETREGGGGIVTRDTSGKESTWIGPTPIQSSPIGRPVSPTAPPTVDRMPPTPVERAPIKVMRDN